MAKIALKNLGRSKVNKTIETGTKMSLYELMNGEGTDDEERMAEYALREVKKYFASGGVWLEPDKKKGRGFWKVFVGLGYHVGDVEIEIEK